jgi:hypothetical protein
MKIQLQPGKTEYTQEEAARALGLTESQFRALLARHVVSEEAALGNVGLMRFRPSDLLLLSVLGAPRQPEESPSHQ